MKTPPVASLKLSKELAEYVILDTYFYWFNRVKVHEDVGEWHYDACDYTLVDYLKIKQFIIDKKRAPDMIENCEKTNLIPAPLSDELGVVLPYGIVMGLSNDPGARWLVTCDAWKHEIKGKTMIEAMTTMAIYLNKKNLIEREGEI